MANSNGKKNGELTREQLVAAAVELNKEIMPDPPIDVATEDVELLKGQIVEAAGIIVPDDDEITPETQHVIDMLEAQGVIPTIEGKPQQVAKPVTEPTSTEPKEEDKIEDKEDLVNLIKAAERIKDLKGIVESNPTFKALRKGMAEGLYRVQDGLALLKKEMMEAMGYEQKGGNGKNSKGETKDKKKQTKEPRQKKETTKRGTGVIATIAQVITDAGKDGVTKEQILKQLIKAFPDKNEGSMKNTINVQVPSRMSKERFQIKKTEDGKYYKA